VGLTTDNSVSPPSRSIRPHAARSARPSWSARASGPRVAHRRRDYRDPRQPGVHRELVLLSKDRCVWRHKFETFVQAREVIVAYIDHYHHRPHSRSLSNAVEVRQTWDDATGPLQNIEA
jgi:hypothetical protein